jgi:hypothetical protein
MTERLNARIDRELARKVKYLRERTGRSTTEIVKASIEAYYDALSAEPAQLLADFVACARGPKDLSTTYKNALTASLEKKGQR